MRKKTLTVSDRCVLTKKLIVLRSERCSTYQMKTFTKAGEKINGISSSDSNTYARLIAIYFYFNGFDLKIRLQRQQNAFDFFPL